jgi:hypothetical protein
VTEQKLVQCVRINGRVYELRRFSLLEYREVHKATGLNMGDFEQAVVDGNPDAVTMLLLLHRRREQPDAKLQFEQIDEPISEFEPILRTEDGRDFELAMEAGEDGVQRPRMVDGKPVVVIDGVEHVGLPERPDPTAPAPAAEASPTPVALRAVDSTTSSSPTEPPSGSSSDSAPGTAAI